MKTFLVIFALEITLISAVENFVGFTAFNSQEISIGGGQGPIIFDSTVVNQGLHYDASTGIFTCPFNGIYYISISFKRDIYNFNVEIVIDGDSALLIEDRGTNNDYSMVSGSGLVRCETDQQISVVAPDGITIEGDFPPESTYTVMLILQTETGDDFIGMTAFKQNTQTYNGGETIQFDGILWSNGEDYEDSVFTCPVSGMYFISYQFSREGTYDMFLDVVKNGSEVLLRSVDSYTNNAEATRSNSRLASCMAGETLSVQAFHSGAISGDSVARSTFTVMYVGDLGDDTLVGFTSSRIETEYEIDVGQPLVFESTLEDLRGNYDNTTGVFSCTAVGIYFVALNMQRTSIERLQAEVMRSNVPAVRVYDTNSANMNSVLTITTLTPCLPGEQITVTPYAEGGIHGSTYPVTTWTVMLMYEY